MNHGPVRSGSAFVERMGDLFERMGQPRIAGRIFGHLLICQPSEQNAAQLRAATGASTGSVSTMLRLLRSAGFVESRGESGGRRRWYRITPGAFSRVLKLRMQLVTELRELAELGLEEVGAEAEDTGRLREMRDCYGFFEREFPAVMARYEAEVSQGA